MQLLKECTLSAEEKQHALDLVLHSQTFARADQLRKFLRYICEMEAAGSVHQITEYAIATEALGRQRNYSPAASSGVRGRAHDLRQKLEQFYEVEAPDANVRIGLRKGSYSPLYYEAEPAQIIEPIVMVPALRPAAPRQTVLERSRTFWVDVILLAVIAVLAVKLFAGHSSRLNPIFDDFWGPMLHARSDVLLCLATPPSLLIKPYREPPRSSEFRPILPDSPWYSRLKIPGGAGQPYMYYSGDSPLFGDGEAAVFAAQVITAGGGSFDLLPENSLRAAVLRNRNVLLIGSSNYSLYAARILKNTPFFIREDSAFGEEVIQERSQTGKAGQSFVPRRDDAGQLVVVYGLITVFANQTQSGQDSSTIVFSGVTGAGTSAAMHFFASETGLKRLRERIRQGGARVPPPCYQVVVKGTRDQAVALTWELAAYRVMLHAPTLE